MSNAGSSSHVEDHATVRRSPTAVQYLPRRSSLHNTTTVRPEARRAYADDGMLTGTKPCVDNDHHVAGAHQQHWGSTDAGKALLEQAANYALLAQRPVSKLADAETAATPSFQSSKPPRRYPLFRSRSGRTVPNVPAAPPALVPVKGPVEGHDGGVCEAAPRLSMSSGESSGGSEVKTPESASANPLWQSETFMSAESDTKTMSRTPFAPPVSHSPALLDLSDATREPHGFASIGLSGAQVAAHFDTNEKLIAAAREMDAEKDYGAPADTNNDAGKRQYALDICKEPSVDSAMAKPTDKARRPGILMSLPHSNFRTDMTVSSGASDASNADQTPLAEGHGAVLRNPMDDAKPAPPLSPAGSAAKEKEASTSNTEPRTAKEGNPFESSDYLQSSQRASSAASESGRIASPDSWRSLLPEHDPYYIASSGLSSPCPSLSSPGNAHTSQQTMSNAMDERRWSSSSRSSLISLPGPVSVAAGYGSPSSSGSAHDLDGTFSSGSRAAFAPLHFKYGTSDRKVSPLPLGGPCSADTRRISATSTAPQPPKIDPRRHASFSTFDSQPAAHVRPSFSHMPFVHPDHIEVPRRSFGFSPGSSSMDGPASPPSLANAGSPDGAFSASMLRGTSSLKSHAMGDEPSRESWPCSRNTLKEPSVALPAKPMAHESHFLDNLLAQETDKKLSSSFADSGQSQQRGSQGHFADDDFHRSPPARSPGGNAARIPADYVTTSTVESVEPSPGEGIATRRTTTTTTTTTTTQFLHGGTVSPLPTQAVSPPAHPSEPRGLRIRADSDTVASPDEHSLPATRHVQGAAVDGDRTLLQDQHLLPQRHWHANNPEEIPHDVTPQVSRSTPFLDKRPPPSSTEFSIETQPTNYVLRTKLPGFKLDGITLATKHLQQLVIVADKWDDVNGGHFERRIAFGPDADLGATRANFDGTTLRISVPRRPGLPLP